MSTSVEPRATRWVVWAAAAFAVVGRFPGLIWPLKPDEAGFLMVARNWDPQPDSLYGTYWVDRPPSIIALVDLADTIGGPFFLRFVAAAGCGALVLLAAAAVRRLASYVDGATRRGTDRAAAFVAVLAAALCTTPAPDSVSAKGEVLGIPLVMGACLAALVALERRSPRLSLLAGLLAVLAVGMKQNMVGGLVFGGVLLLGALATRRLTGGEFGRLATAALVGAALPVAATVGWALAVGVDLSTLWYAVYGFRSDAIDVITSQSTAAPEERVGVLLSIGFASGMIFAGLWFVLNLPRLLRRLPVPTLAVAAMLGVDLAGLVLGGSFWRPYLIVLFPPLVLALALVLVADARPLVVRRPLDRLPEAAREVAPTIAVFAAISTLISLVLWTKGALTEDTPTEFYVGEAIGRAAEPGDTLTVYGGRADLQWGSGLPSPYEYLWSLPMRTLDPELAGLEALLQSPAAPTWLVEAVPLTSWDNDGAQALAPVLEERYEVVAEEACGRFVVHRLRSAERPPLELDCDEPYHRFLGQPW